ncbi:carbohydrate binding-domain-containing protein [Mycena metata]|uniref:Carbohydrate binding-domain-containing protein n=1 Tax=Mycena metata TaxID=1033252 RepID=A0AAD7IYN4_9AGAR|nr:carbohydrate binding-domain-containing protein [Mycena metata]
MGRLLPVVLSALLAWIAVTAQALQSCGRSNYDPSQYTCFDDDFLCPIVNGDVLIRCGEACYSTSRFSCSNFTLKPFFPDGPATLQDCGFFIKFDPSFFVCLDGDFICPITNGVAMLKCDQTCYAPAEFGCALNQLYPVGTPPPTCVPEFGDDEVCDENGCFTLPCCGDLISVADKCRDRCMLAPETCPDAHA